METEQVPVNTAAEWALVTKGTEHAPLTTLKEWVIVTAESERAPLTTETEGAPLTTKTEGAQLTTETEGAPLTTKTERAQLTTETEGAQLTTETEGAPLTTKTERAQLTTETEGAQLTTETEGAQLTTETEGAQLTTETEGAPLTTKTEGAPVTTETEPSHSISQHFPGKSLNVLSPPFDPSNHGQQSPHPGQQMLHPDPDNFGQQPPIPDAGNHGQLTPTPEPSSQGLSAPPPPPPPPPPPLPPPPLPPPPPPPGSLQRSMPSRQSKLRRFNWDALPHHRVVGKQNIWTTETGPEQIAIDTRSMEELFARQELVPTARRSLRARSPQRSGDMEVSILDAKKSMNIGIFLKQFKRPVESIVADIQQGMGGSYGAEKLVELSKLLPDKEEVKKLQEFRGDRERVCEAERFLLLLTELPNYEQHLECLILKEEFSPQMEALRAGVRTLTEAASELLNCEELHTVIRLVLKTGNYMNAGGYAGNAFGFRMASLVKLADTRANRPGMNLMHFVVMEAEKNDKKLLDFPSKLQNVAAASRIFKQDIENNTERLKHKLQMVKGNFSKVPELRKQMEKFVKEAEGQLEQLQEALGRLDTVSKNLAEFLCEDQFCLEESCSIFQNFSEKFLAAMEENRQRQSKEMRRRQCEEEAAKRLSIASCSHRERGLTNPDADLESLLLGNRRSFRQRPLSERLPRSQSLRLVSGPAQAPNTAVALAPAPPALIQAPVVSPSPAPNPSVVPPAPSTAPSPEEVLRLRQVSERLLGVRTTRRLGSGPRPERSGQVTCSLSNTAAPDPDSTPVPSSGHPHNRLPLAKEQTQAVAPVPPTLPATAASVASLPLAPPSRPSTGRSLSADIPEPSRPRVRLSRGFSVDRPTLPAAHGRPSSTSIASILRRHSSSSSTPSHRRPSTLFQRQRSTSSPTRRRRSSASRSLRGAKPPAADRPQQAEETKATGSGLWSISNLFGKKPPKTAGGAGGAAAESEAKEPAVTPSRGSGFFSSLFKGFSGHKGSKH